MSRFQSSDVDVKVIKPDERYVIKAPDLDAFAEVMDILEPYFTKKKARLLDYDGKRFVLLISLGDHEVLKELPDDIVVKVAENGPVSKPSKDGES